MFTKSPQVDVIDEKGDIYAVLGRAEHDDDFLMYIFQTNTPEKAIAATKKAIEQSLVEYGEEGEIFIEAPVLVASYSK